jgi:hypothetical protein
LDNEIVIADSDFINPNGEWKSYTQLSLSLQLNGADNATDKEGTGHSWPRGTIPSDEMMILFFIFLRTEMMMIRCRYFNS